MGAPVRIVEHVAGFGEQTVEVTPKRGNARVVREDCALTQYHAQRPMTDDRRKRGADGCGASLTNQEKQDGFQTNDSACQLLQRQCLMQLSYAPQRSFVTSHEQGARLVRRYGEELRLSRIDSVAESFEQLLVPWSLDLSNRGNVIENSTKKWLAVRFSELAALSNLVRCGWEASDLINRIAKQRHNFPQRP